jgi:hypothetical protein
MFLFADDITFYLKDPKISNRNLSNMINIFSKVTSYKINIQKSVTFLYTNNKQTEKEIRPTISFIIA